MSNLDLTAFNSAVASVVDLGAKLNAATEVKYPVKRDIRKALQLVKVEAQKARVAANALGKK
jgi:hypothetical protein